MYELYNEISADKKSLIMRFMCLCPSQCTWVISPEKIKRSKSTF